MTTRFQVTILEDNKADRKENIAAYPEKVTDLKPDQLVSDPVVFIDYDLFPGLPAEAQEALLKAVSAFESFSDSGAMPRAVAATAGRGVESRKALTRVAHLKCYERVTTGWGA